jgi:hypothetical protein
MKSLEGSALGEWCLAKRTEYQAQMEVREILKWLPVRLNTILLSSMPTDAKPGIGIELRSEGSNLKAFARGGMKRQSIYSAPCCTIIECYDNVG